MSRLYVYFARHTFVISCLSFGVILTNGCERKLSSPVDLSPDFAADFSTASDNKLSLHSVNMLPASFFSMAAASDIQTLSVYKNKIRVIVPEHELHFSKVTGFDHRSEYIGIDFDLLQDFRRTTNSEVEIFSFAKAEDALKAFQNGKGDLLIGRWHESSTQPRALNFPLFEETHISLYCPKSSRKNVLQLPQTINYLIPEKTFPTFQSNKLNALSNLKIQRRNSSEKALLRTVSSRRNTCAFLEETKGDFEKRFFPQIEKVYRGTRRYSVGWKIQPHQQGLAREIQQWYAKAKARGHITQIHHQYRSPIHSINDRDTLQLRRNLHSRLPFYQRLFEKSAREVGVPWTLLAAVSYQESHWNNDAVSPTHVRGIMQITRGTAATLGIQDILSVEETIPGGARYLQLLFEKWPVEVNYLIRLKLTLASYNMGYQHVLDCQAWLVKRGLNPYSWRDLKRAFRAKADPKAAGEFVIGNARGLEALSYVERVIAFDQALKSIGYQRAEPYRAEYSAYYQ